MRGLTLHQPWASLVALGLKRYETRSWGTDYRGPLLIHAGRHWTRAQAEFLERLNRALVDGFYGDQYPPLPAKLPLGCVVAMGRIACCEKSGLDWLSHYEPLERAVGDLSVGRWAWKLAEVEALEPPIPCRGMQGLWPVPIEVQDKIPWEHVR